MRAFAAQGSKLSYQHSGGLLDGAVGHEGGASLGGGGIDLGDGGDAHGSR